MELTIAILALISSFVSAYYTYKAYKNSIVALNGLSIVNSQLQVFETSLNSKIKNTAFDINDSNDIKISGTTIYH